MFTNKFLSVFIFLALTPQLSLANGLRCESIFNMDIARLDYITSSPAAKELKGSYDLLHRLQTEKGVSLEALVTRYKELNFIFNTEFKVANSIKTTLELAALSLEYKLSSNGLAKYLVLLDMSFKSGTHYKVPFKIQAVLAEYGLQNNFTAAKVVQNYLAEFRQAQQEGPVGLYEHSNPFERALLRLN